MSQQQSTEEKLSAVEVGQVVNVTAWRPPESGRGSLEQRKVDVTILPACDDKKGGQWVCVTHDEGFANQFEKDSHIHEGEHQLAWNCKTHGLEAP